MGCIPVPQPWLPMQEDAVSGTRGPQQPRFGPKAMTEHGCPNCGAQWHEPGEWHPSPCSAKPPPPPRSFVSVLIRALDDMHADFFEPLEDAVSTLLELLRDAGYYIACSDCNASNDGIHYVGCSVIAPARTSS